MTGKERIIKMLRHEPADRIPIYEHFWGDTHREWVKTGHMRADESMENHFNFDMQELWAFNLVADLDFTPQVVAETEETITFFDGNGATLKRHKLHDSTPEHIDFMIKDRTAWEEKIKPKLTPDIRRINFNAYRAAKEDAARHDRFFVWSGVNVFECIHPVCGHEYMLMGMVDDPEWVKDMADTYGKLTVELQKILFEKEGYPDGIWYYEDMGYKGSPFMSPDMYREIIKPAHKYTIDYAKQHNLPVIMHSCGYVEPLVPDMIDAGIDCLEVIEIKAGMDLLKLNRLYGDKISFMGGIDVRKLYTNDKNEIDKELSEKIPEMKKSYNYCVHSDHSIPKTVNYETYRYFIDKVIQLGKY